MRVHTFGIDTSVIDGFLKTLAARQRGTCYPPRKIRSHLCDTLTLFLNRRSKAELGKWKSEQVLALCRKVNAHPLSDCFASVDSPEGRRLVADFLQAQLYPYEPHPDKAGLLIRIEANGKRTVGGFVNRQFEQVKIKSPRR